MKIVTTFHQPSSVLCSLKCQLASRDLEHLVVAKLNRIDVYSLQNYGLQHECSLEIWGKVLTIKSVPIPGSSRSNILLMIAHPDPELIFLSYSESNAGTGELTARRDLSLHERNPRPAEFFNDVLVHPSGKLMVAACYSGKLKVIMLKAGNYHKEFDVSLPELNVLSMVFLPTPEDEYALAILHLDYQERVQLLARDILVDDSELSSFPSTVLPQTSISSKVLPFPTETVPRLVPAPPTEHTNSTEDSSEFFTGGVLVVGGKQILFFDLADRDGQEKQRGKRRRLESRKKSGDTTEILKAKEKEEEREGRKRNPKGCVEWPWSEVTALCAVDSSSLRIFLGDSYGKLSMLSLDHFKEKGLILIPLGEGSPPTTLTYLTNQTLYLGSHLGDSQLLQISQVPISSLDMPTLPIPPGMKTIPHARLGAPNSGKKGKGKATPGDADDDTEDPAKGCVIESTGCYVSIIDTYKNIAPIMDAVLVATESSGQKQIVTCSGGGNTGSVNIVRSGADFQETASILGLANITNIWGVRALYEDARDSYIFVSTLQRSHLFQINDSGSRTTLSRIEDSTLDGLITNSLTLAFGNVTKRVKTADGKASYVDSQYLVQVTPQGAFLLEYEMVLGSYVQLAKWKPNGSQVVAASLNPSQVVLALSKGRLVVLSITEHANFGVIVPASTEVGPDISAVSCAPLDPSKFFTTYVTVSYWRSNIVEIFSIGIKGLTSVSKSSPLPALVRSVLLYNFGCDSSSKGEDYHPYLLVGLGDGSVVTFTWKDKELKDKKVISLGFAPVSLTGCNIEGKQTVFAAGNRATILFWEKRRLHNSPIMLKEVVAVSRLNTTTFPSSLILGTSSGLFIGRITALDKMHIRSIPFGLDNPRRLAYQPLLKAFGVACSRTEPCRIGDAESVRSSFRLVDDTTFSNLGQYNCEVDEEISAITAVSPTINKDPMPLFCLGTFFYRPGETEPTAGRLLIFTAHDTEPHSKLQLSLITSADVRGCVYSLALVNDMIVAAVNSSVMLFRFTSTNEEPSPSFALKSISEWNHNYMVTSLANYGDYIVAGDQISSVSLLKISDSKVYNIARDYGPLWPVCVEATDEKNIIGANDALNLFTFTLAHNLGRATLERNGSYHLADLVNKFIRGSITSSDPQSSNVALEPRHLFFTSSGRIGAIVDVTDEQLSLHLTALQRNLAGVVKGVGCATHTSFRAPRNTRGRSDADVSSFGFLDGDFLEQFLTAQMGSPERVEKIVAGHTAPERLSISLEELQKVLENLQAMH